MARNQQSKKRNNSYRPNGWGFLQNVLIAAMNKGQLPGMVIALLLIILFCRYPAEELPVLVENLLNISKVNSILGWILAVGITFVGYLVNRWQRRIHTKEIQRISKEKRQLQEKLTNAKLPSSNKATV